MAGVHIALKAVAKQPVMRLGDRKHGEQAAKHERADCRAAQRAWRAHAPTQRGAHSRAHARRTAEDGDSVAVRSSGAGEEFCAAHQFLSRAPCQVEAAVLLHGTVKPDEVRVQLQVECL